MKEASKSQIKEYLKTSKTRKNLYCEYCLDLKHGHIMGKKVKCTLYKPYIKNGIHYAWALICPKCNSREVLGY